MPSLTVIPIWPYSPADDDVGVPDKRPVEALKDAHGGRFTIAKLSASPSGSEAEGVNVYDCPATTAAGGEPEIVGALFEGLGAGASQISRMRLALQFGESAPAIVANPSKHANSARTALARTTDVDGAISLKWQPRYRGHSGRQTGSFASPPFDGFAAFHWV